MGLELYYKEQDIFYAISHSGDLSQPLNTVHDGKPGDTQTVQLYIRNSDATKWFSVIRIQPVDLVDAEPYGDIIYTETGWGVKLSTGAVEPTLSEWEDIEWGNEINIGNVGATGVPDVATYSPLWYLITCPPNTDAKIKTDIVLEVSYTENAVI